MKEVTLKILSKKELNKLPDAQLINLCKTSGKLVDKISDMEFDIDQILLKRGFASGAGL